MTLQERKVMELALEALEVSLDQTCNVGRLKDWQQIHKALTVIEEALAQPEQEPVAWMSDRAVGFVKSQFGSTPVVPLYTAPPAKPLTGEELAKLKAKNQ